MGINRSDCISIGEKTYNFSMEDACSSPEGFDTRNVLEGVDHQEGLAEDELSATVVESEVYSKRYQHPVQDSVFSNYAPKDQIYKQHQLKSSSSSLQYENRISINLKRSIDTLSRVCGNDKFELTREAETDTNKLSEILNSLSENCELKLKFYEKNYKFLENLYDSLTREHDSMKTSLSSKENQIRELSLKYTEMEKLVKRTNGHPEVKPHQSPQTSQTTASNEKDLQSQLIRQQKEIREYKRFIKELMDRE